MLPEKRVAEVESIGNSLKRMRPESSVEVVNQDVNMAANGNCSDVNIDEDLHSRQLAVYGRDAMRRLFGANVLISGLQGLGCEIAKNVILAGIKSVTLHDSSDVEMWDLSGNFYLSDSDIGENRALACSNKLQELNSTVVVSTLTSELSKEDLANFQVVVVTSVSLEKAIEYDEFCRAQKPPIAFIKADIYGLFGGVFCDFGPEFTVVDIDGEEPHTGIIASISHDSPALVSCVEDERLEFQDGDLVIFTEVQGMGKLNDGKPRKVKNVKAFSFMLEEDTTNFGIYTKGGIVTQVKEPKVLKFQSLAEALKSPGEFLLSDFSKFDRPPLLHIAFQALDKFIQRCGRFPLPASDEDASLLIELSRTINADSDDKKLDTLDVNILKHLASGSRAVLNPMAAVFGGIVGQEIVKACSGKFHPLFQFFYFDSLESLPEKPLKVEELAPLNSRYDAQVSVFGREMQRKLENAKLFVVGAGALGCELLKNLALMGVSCGNQGKLTITDDDIIERSNLSRQFLFRDWNIGQAKSTVAASAAMAVNADLRIEALQNRVCPATEIVFDYAFWEGLDVILNALDNVNARLYVDSRCVYFQKPLLESGTLGTKCNTQMVIPHKTENYGASRDPPEKQAPMCTVHSFPHNIDHCLTWARSELEGLLEKTPAESNAFLSNPEEYKEAVRSSKDAQARDLLERVVECLVTERCTTFEDCVAWARNKFEDYFSNRVKQLTYTFPEDALTTAGTPFWSAPKRFPKPLKFNTNDPSHMSLLAAASILRATVFGIDIPDWTSKLEKLTKVVERVQVLEFKPKQGVKIETDEKGNNMKPSSVDDSAELSNLLKVLETGASKLSQGFRMNPIQFEKDDDTNYHMDLIAGLANMRARNYGIPEVDKLKAKFIAGRIIPAVATTTAMATGLVCLELYKVLLGHGVDKYRNTFANLALPFFAMAEPMPPKTVTHAKLTWSVWDRWAVEGNLTLQELINWFKAKDLSADIISCGQRLLYNSFIPGHNVRLDKRVLDLAKNISKLELPPRSRHFDITVACQDNEGKEIDVPLISIYFQ